MFKMMLLMFAIMISTCYGSNAKAYRQKSMIYQPDDFETELSSIPYPHIEEKLSSLAVPETFLSEYLPYTEIEDSMIKQPSTIFNTNVKQLSKLKMQWRPRRLHYENDSIQILTMDGQLKKEYSQMKTQRQIQIHFVDSKRIMIFNAGEKTIKFQNQKDYTMWKNEFEKNATKENKNSPEKQIGKRLMDLHGSSPTDTDGDNIPEIDLMWIVDNTKMSTEYHGVYKSRCGGTAWGAYLKIDDKYKFLGTWKTEKEAALRVKQECEKRHMELKNPMCHVKEVEYPVEYKTRDEVEVKNKSSDKWKYGIVVSEGSLVSTNPSLKVKVSTLCCLGSTTKHFKFIRKKNEENSDAQHKSQNVEIEIETRACYSDKVYGTDTFQQRIESLKDCAKLETWYSNSEINYKGYMEQIEQFHWERFLRTERDYPETTESKEKLKISLVALKTFMEYKFLREDPMVRYNKALFKNLEEENEFLEAMKEIVPLQIYGKDRKGQPVVYVDGTNKEEVWNKLENLINEKTIEEPELGLKKLIYYKYRKVLRFIPNRYLLITDATEATNELNILKERLPTIKKLNDAKKYELDMKIVNPDTNDVHGHIMFVKLPQYCYFFSVVRTQGKKHAPDTYFNPPDQLQPELQKFIEKDQIPKDYNKNNEGTQFIDWKADEPQNFEREMHL